jgi:hypothetical protein
LRSEARAVHRRLKVGPVGLNALDPAITQLFADDYDALLVGRDAVRRLSWRQLRPDLSIGK